MTIEEMKAKFAAVFGDAEGVQSYFSPGRVNLIGEHTDYNGGHVFPCALTIGTYAVARKRTDDKLRFYSANVEKYGTVECSVKDIKYNDKYGWANYPIGVVWALQKKGHHFDSGFDMLIWGDIPNGSGLSSSASLEVLTGVVIRDLFGFNGLTNQDLALTGQYSENNFNGMNCGIMDQFAVAMGKKDNAIFLDTADLSYEYAPVKLPDAKIVIVNSKVKHSLVDSEYNKRREECAHALKQLQTVVNINALGDLDEATFDKHASVITDETERKRAHHAVYENQRTIRAVSELKKNNIKEFGKLMNASHVSLRDDYATSCE
ncbi:MAG: galactokinase, partial [Lachnospiraceae bacterium]|nr:galactokinase [Lachnospiraceae bacterium]